MRKLLRFIIQNHFIILFLLIESFSLFLLFSRNPYQKFTFYRFSHSIINRIASRISNLEDYFSLYHENRALVEENTKLYNQLASSYPGTTSDTIYRLYNGTSGTYLYIPARIINNTVNNQYNYITINKGSRDQIEPDMAVICNNGIVGYTKSVSKNFTVVLPALNLDFIVSGKIKKSGYYGPVSWNGVNANLLTLVDIPHHVTLNQGDTVITSGYGGIFPEGYLIGTIEDFRLKGGNYYEINIKLSSDFRRLDNVQVIRHHAKQELDSLQNLLLND
ncbi:MAG: rod shape-determining protein MreC [Bacteroidales bacterium]|nr:rod shape-determining protein MreC [Bacteroidales bacterium]